MRTAIYMKKGIIFRVKTLERGPVDICPMSAMTKCCHIQTDEGFDYHCKHRDIEEGEVVANLALLYSIQHRQL